MEMTGAKENSIDLNKDIARLSTANNSLPPAIKTDAKSDSSSVSTNLSAVFKHADTNTDHRAVDRACEAWKETGAKMYLRVLTGSQAHPMVTTKALVDTGDLGPSLVSDKFAKYMGWQILPTQHKVGQAVQGKPAPVLGRTKVLSFCLENFSQIFNWKFVVIKDLFTPIIFGYDWLSVLGATIELDQKGNNFMHVYKEKSISAPLVNQSAQIMPPGGKWAGAQIFKQKRGGEKPTPPHLAAVQQPLDTPSRAPTSPAPQLPPDPGEPEKMMEVEKEVEKNTPTDIETVQEVKVDPHLVCLCPPLLCTITPTPNVAPTLVQEKQSPQEAKTVGGGLPSTSSHPSTPTTLAAFPEPSSTFPLRAVIVTSEDKDPGPAWLEEKPGQEEGKLNCILELRPQKKVRLKAHHRTWIAVTTQKGYELTTPILVEEEILRERKGRKDKIVAREVITELVKGKTNILVENHSSQHVVLNTNYVIAVGRVMTNKTETEDWTQGHTTHLAAAPSPPVEPPSPPEADGSGAWPTEEQLHSRGQNSWWDPCKGMGDQERRKWVEETFHLKENSYLTANQDTKKELIDLLSEFTDIFSGGANHTEAIPESDWVSLDIKTVEGAPAVFQRPRHLSPPDQEDLERQLAIWIRQKVVVPSVEGAWALNLVPVNKKHVSKGVRRWTLDARPLNAITLPMPQYIGSVAANLEGLAQKQLFSSIDLANAFLSIPINPADRHKASFTTPKNGCWSFTRSGYGLMNSPAALEILGQALTRDVEPGFMDKYMDDFLCSSMEPKEHLNALRQFFENIRAANVKMQASKCSFLKTSTLFLGHLVVGPLDPDRQAGLHKDPELSDTILKTPLPEDAPALKRYLGQLAFYNSFMENISEATASLHQAKNRVPFVLSEEEKADFRSSLIIFEQSPALAFLDFENIKENPPITGGDWSDIATSASLHQWQRGGLRLVGACGRVNRGAAKRYGSDKPGVEGVGSMRGEASALDLVLHKWGHILRRQWWVHVTDSLSLTHINKTRDPTGYWGRFLERLGGYRVTLAHRPGKDSPVEDFWSRCEHHPSWSSQESKLLTDYESDTDEERGPGVPKSIPEGLGEILKRKSKGLKKPFELIGASYKDSLALEATPVLASLVAEDMPESEAAGSPNTAHAPLTEQENEYLDRAAEFPPESETSNSPYNFQDFFTEDENDYLDLVADIQPGGDATYERYYRTGQMYSSDSETDEEEEELHFSTLMHASGSRVTEYGSRLSAVYSINKKDTGQPKRLTEEDKKKRQDRDSILQNVYRWLQTGKRPNKAELRGRPQQLHDYYRAWNLLELHEGVIYMKPTKEGQRMLRWCVPNACITDALWLAHVVEGCHMAVRSTLSRLIIQTYWPDMRRDTEYFVISCPGCRPKNKQPKPSLKVHRPKLQHTKNQTWYVDLVGPLMTSDSGHNFILTCLDGFTRYASAVPLTGKRAADVIPALSAIVNLWASPGEIVHDQGKEFENTDFRAFCNRRNIKVTTSIAYEPRANKVERLHRVVGALLRSVLAEHAGYQKWPLYLPEVLRAYNTSVSSVTGFTPFRLQTGEEHTGPLSAWVGSPPTGQRPEVEDVLRDRVLRNTIDTLRALTNQKVYMRRKSQSYIAAGGQQFCPTVGMKVYWWCPAAIKVLKFDGSKQTVSKKLANTWTGPWIVTKMLTDQVSVISELVKGKQNKKNTRTVSVDRLEEYREGYSWTHSADTVIPLPSEHTLSLDAEDDTYTEDIDVNLYNEDESDSIAGLGGNRDAFPHLHLPVLPEGNLQHVQALERPVAWPAPGPIENWTPQQQAMKLPPRRSARLAARSRNPDGVESSSDSSDNEGLEDDEAPRYSPPPVPVESPADLSEEERNDDTAPPAEPLPQAAATPAPTPALKAQKTVESLQSAYLRVRRPLSGFSSKEWRRTLEKRSREKKRHRKVSDNRSHPNTPVDSSTSNSCEEMEEERQEIRGRQEEQGEPEQEEREPRVQRGEPSKL